MATKQEISKRDAAAFIESVLTFIYKLEEGQVKVTQTDVHQAKQATYEVGNQLRTIASEYGLEVPRKCEGDAHSPGVDYDHCMVCINGFGWGVAGKRVKITR